MHEWVDAVGAAGTLVAIGTSLLLLRQEQGDRHDAADVEKREQASRMTCWADWAADWDGATFAQPACPSVLIRNASDASDASVYEVFVDIVSPVDGMTIRADIGALGSGGTAAWNYEEPFNTEAWVPEALLPALYFQDAGDHAWRRAARGVLVPDPGAEAGGPVRQLPRQR